MVWGGVPISGPFSFSDLSGSGVTAGCPSPPPPPWPGSYFTAGSPFKFLLCLSITGKVGELLGAGSVQFSSVAHSCPTVFKPMDCSTPGLPVYHRLPEFTQTHSIESVVPSNHLILCRPLLLPPSIFPSIRVFPSESAPRIRKQDSCGQRDASSGK